MSEGGIEPGALVRDLRATIDALDLDALGVLIGDDLGLPAPDATQRLRRYTNEAVATLNMVAPLLHPGQRVLEVGSGTGLVAHFLAGRGLDVVELEPIGLGFQFIEAARRALAGATPRPAAHLDLGADELAADRHGRFDLVYSFNVIEHVPDWRNALERIVDVLADDGVALQSCPNYTIPYEPHFALPLVPGRPALTARVLPARVAESDLWHSLNWITARGVRRWADDHGLQATFARGQIADALGRLATDAEFRARHRGVLPFAAKVLHRTGALALVRRLPPGLSTPMQFELRRRA